MRLARYYITKGLNQVFIVLKQTKRRLLAAERHIRFLILRQWLALPRQCWISWYHAGVRRSSSCRGYLGQKIQKVDHVRYEKCCFYIVSLQDFQKLSRISAGTVIKCQTDRSARGGNAVFLRCREIYPCFDLPRSGAAPPSYYIYNLINAPHTSHSKK